MRPTLAFVFGLLLSSMTIAQPPQAPIIELEEDRYEAALEKAVKERKPLFVYVGASWCAPCKQMKRELIEPMQKAGEFDEVIFVELDFDKDEASDLCEASKMVPQFLCFNPRSKKAERFRAIRPGYAIENDESRLQIRAVIRKALGK